ncbi:MAG: uroporphyrinogen decarboxylase family protein [Armatimonadota bacterium]
MPTNIRGVRVWDPEWVATRGVSYRPLIAAVEEHCDIIPVAGVDGAGAHFLTAASADITETLVIDAGDWDIHRTTIHTPRGGLSQDYWVSKSGDLPLTKKHFVVTPEDAERVLSVPYVMPELDFSYYFELRDQWPDNCVMCFCPHPGEAVHDLLGTETFAYWWVEHRDLLFALRAVFEERALAVLDAMLTVGVGPVLACNGVEQVAPPIHSAETYRAFALPPFREMCRRIHQAGCLLHVHCHNRVSGLLEDFAEVGIDTLHPLEPPPMGDVELAEAKRRVGDRICLEGNIQIGELYAAPTERIVALVEEAMRAGKPGGGFILCPTASPYTPAMSHQTVSNYLAMVETAVRLRGY